MVKFLKKTFLNDGDGFSARDFLMVSISSTFLLFLLVTFFSPYFGFINPVALDVIRSMDGVMMTMVGGVFAVQGVVQGVREYRKSSTNETPVETIEKEEEDVGTDSEPQHKV